MRKSKYLYLPWFVLSLLTSSLAFGGEPLPNNRYEDGITLTITSKPFDPKAHAIKKCEYAICVIDGRFIYGGNGDVPKEEVTSFVFEQNGKKIELDVSSMYDSGVNNANIKQHISVTKWGRNSYQLVGYFSDGDDTYIGRWLVSPDGAIRHYLGDYETLVSLTTKVQRDYGLPSTTGPDSNQ
jgi:hypothetical protein